MQAWSIQSGDAPTDLTLREQPRPALGEAGDRDVRPVLEQLLETPARRRFVVDDERADWVDLSHGIRCR